MSNREGGWSLLAFIAGVVVGASIALVFAPAPGEETRKKLKEAAKKAGDYVVNKAKETFEKGEEKEEENEG